MLHEHDSVIPLRRADKKEKPPGLVHTCRRCMAVGCEHEASNNRQRVMKAGGLEAREEDHRA